MQSSVSGSVGKLAADAPFSSGFSSFMPPRCIDCSGPDVWRSQLLVTHGSTSCSPWQFQSRVLAVPARCRKMPGKALGVVGFSGVSLSLVLGLKGLKGMDCSLIQTCDAALWHPGGVCKSLRESGRRARSPRSVATIPPYGPVQDRHRRSECRVHHCFFFLPCTD